MRKTWLKHGKSTCPEGSVDFPVDCLVSRYLIRPEETSPEKSFYYCEATESLDQPAHARTNLNRCCAHKVHIGPKLSTGKAMACRLICFFSGGNILKNFGERFLTPWLICCFLFPMEKMIFNINSALDLI